MNQAHTFDYDRFVALNASELVAYVEPLLIDHFTNVPKDVLKRMLVELPTYDEYHLVYALLLGMQHSPQTFLPYIPQYLAHTSDSVCCTAFNALDRLSDDDLTPAVVESVRNVISSRPVKPFVADILDSLQTRSDENGRERAAERCQEPNQGM